MIKSAPRDRRRDGAGAQFAARASNWKWGHSRARGARAQCGRDGVGASISSRILSGNALPTNGFHDRDAGLVGGDDEGSRRMTGDEKAGRGAGRSESLLTVDPCAISSYKPVDRLRSVGTNYRRLGVIGTAFGILGRHV